MSTKNLYACVVCGKYGSPGVSNFPFPSRKREPERFMKFCENMQLFPEEVLDVKNQRPQKQARICQKHFVKEDFFLILKNLERESAFSEKTLSQHKILVKEMTGLSRWFLFLNLKVQKRQKQVAPSYVFMEYIIRYVFLLGQKY